MTTVHRTICPLDCPDTCALEVGVVAGRIASIAAARDPQHPTVEGFICSKVGHFAERVYHPDRLLHPMRRTGPKGAGQFARISWERALGEIAARFAQISSQHGAEAILPFHYGGSNGQLSDGLLDDYFFARLGASRLGLTICAVPATKVALGMYGKMPGVAFEDYPHAKFILIWGANPKASNIHLVPFLRRARRNGAFIAVVDPRNNFSAGEVDLHLPVYPGADLPLALGMIHFWNQRGLLARDFLARHADGLEALLAQAEAWPIERAAEAARVPAADLRRLAETYAAASPAVLRAGWGLERNRNGAQAMAAILAMPSLLGKFGVRGGGYTLSNSGAAKLDTAKVLGAFSWTTRELNMTQLGAILTNSLPDGKLTPPVHALYVYNANPASTVPDQESVLRGLAREDLFTVVHDQVMTDTAGYADIVLPATTFLEHWDIRRGYGAYVAGGVRPVIEPCGEARPNEAVFAALGRAMGFSDAPFQWDTPTLRGKVCDAMTLAGHPLDRAAIEAGRIQRYDFPGPQPVQFGNVMPYTPDRKVHLTPQVLGPQPFRYQPVTSDAYPLALISPATSRMISSTLGEFNYAELRVTLNPRDAAAHGIAEGDKVRVSNELGAVECRARISQQVRQGVVSMPKGAWQKSSPNARTATALCPATVNDVGGAACFNDARVQVSRLPA